jgi:hypothetical protein
MRHAALQASGWSGAACAAGGKMSHGRPFDPKGVGIRLPLQTMTLVKSESDSWPSTFL